MEYKYYRSKGMTGKIIIDEINEAFQPVLEARKELLQKYEADGLFLSGIYSDTPSALGFKEKLENPKYLSYSGFFNGYHKYIPKKNTKIGKKLFKELGNENLKFSFSEFILTKFNVNRIVRDKENDELFVSQAGIINDVILLAIPGSPNDSDDNLEYSSQPFPDIPIMFVELSEEEFNKFQNQSRQQS